MRTVIYFKAGERFYQDEGKPTWKKLISDETLFLTKTTLKPVEVVKIQDNTKYINCTIQTLKNQALKLWRQQILKNSSVI